ncbi:MAG: dimethylsulfonioproprionate lyase family protein [Pseudomonadota bacterium]
MTDLSPTQTTTPITEVPDWRYLLREFYEMYRFMSSGGSKPIRAHQRSVREAINRVLNAKPQVVLPAPEALPVTAHLTRALSEGYAGATAPMVRTLASVSSDLVWRYGYDRMPRGLARSYGYAEIAGPRGPVITNEVILGVVLFAPGCTYPAHAHEGITESYVCLSGAVSENNHGVYAPGSMIYNPPGTVHRITVSDNEPALLAYAWTGLRRGDSFMSLAVSRSADPVHA